MITTPMTLLRNMRPGGLSWRVLALAAACIALTATLGFDATAQPLPHL